MTTSRVPTPARTRLLAACGLASLIGGFAAFSAATAGPPSHDDIAGAPDLVVQDAARDLKQTKVAGALDEPHAPGLSILWCSTLQLAWDELRPVLGEPMSARGADPLAERLNGVSGAKGDLDEGSYVAVAGFGRDGIVEKIRAQLQEKFKGAASPGLLPTSVPSDSILAYAYLFKNLAFERPFIRREVAFGFQGQQMLAFGLWPDPNVEHRAEIARQVVVHWYDSPTEWTAELRNTSRGDRLIIARARPGATLADTVATIAGTLDGPGRGEFGDDDRLVIPLLNFDITRRFDELIGAKVAGPKVAGRIDEALQNIRFRLDERGAVLKSEAAIGVKASMPVQRTRVMVCDGPFAILMMREGAKAPYFAAWIESPELLVAWR